LVRKARLAAGFSFVRYLSAIASNSRAFSQSRCTVRVETLAATAPEPSSVLLFALALTAAL
jgi:hypothetical protein